MLKNGFVSQAKAPKMKHSKPVKSTHNARIATKIISDTPGRLRLRVAQGHRQSERIHPLVNALQGHCNINQVRMNLDQGSITINHEGEDSWKNVMATLKDLGIIFGDIVEVHTDAAIAVSNAVIDLNKQVKQATEGQLDIRVLFPFGLGCLAIRQLIIKGLQFDIIPWYVLAWYAFDSFIKLHGTNRLEPTSDS
jgi:Heavy metal associated domain 2